MIKPYQEYKDSEVEWIGNVPRHWSVLAIKRLSTVQRGASPRPIDDPVYFDENGEYIWTRISDVTKSKTYLYESEQRLSKLGASLSVKLEPDSLFLSIAGTVGKACITKVKACIHDGFVYFPDFKENYKFLYYAFESGQPYKGLGKQGTQLNLNTETVGNIKIALPEAHEQSLIIDFLDKKTSQIDDLLSEKTNFINLLKEKRQALISHVVTKGLDPNVKMKDSGVEWIGEVPEHWATQPLKLLGDILSGFAIDSNAFTETGVRVIKISNIQPMYIDWADESFVSESYFNKVQRFQVKNDDLLIALTRPIISTGIKAAFIKDANYPLLLNQRCACFRTKDSFDKSFLYNVIFSKYFISQFENSIDATGQQPNISPLDIGNLKILVPPLNEQIKISSFLERKTYEIDNLIKETENSIGLLNEHRSAIISAAVTGKIDVRDHMNNNKNNKEEE